MSPVNGGSSASLPGPPGELQRIWRAALERPELQEVFARANNPANRILRFFGLPESAIAGVVTQAGGEAEGLEVTICAHDLEVQVDLVIPQGSEAQADRLTEALRAAHPRALFAEDEEAVEAIVLGVARERGLTIGAAESCTGGLVSARLTSVPGSSDVFVGGIVAYDDRLKLDGLNVPAEVLERHGAVSAETAAAMAAGARSALGTDVGVSVTGVAGPGGGTPGKPGGCRRRSRRAAYRLQHSGKRGSDYWRHEVRAALHRQGRGRRVHPHAHEVGRDRDPQTEPVAR